MNNLLYSVIISAIIIIIILYFLGLKRKYSINNLQSRKKNVLSFENVKISKYPKFFPRRSCLELSNYVYNLISVDKISDVQLILEIILLKYEIVDEAFRRCQGRENFDKVKQYLNEVNTKFQIFNYLKDLIIISKEFYEFNVNNRFIVREFVSSLFSKSITLGMTFFSLELKITEIFDFLKETNPNFKLNRKKKQELVNKNGYKECSRCREIKPYAKFDTTKGRLRYICRECAIIKKSIYIFKKKIKVLKSLFKSTKCNECDAGLERLPCLEIHHNDRDAKTFSWRDLTSRNAESILEELKTQDVEILCTNCHLIKQASNYSEHKNFILNSFFLEVSEEVIRNIVYNYVKNQNLSYRSTEKQQIVKWIKKRIIIYKLFNDKCIGCDKGLGEIELASFEFHHINEKVADKSRWQEISTLDLDQIYPHLINQQCISLCANCHQIIHTTNFIENLEKIFPKSENKLIELIRSNYERIIKNINQFDYKPINHPYLFTYENWLTPTKLRIISLLEGNSYSINEICDSLDLKRSDCFSKLQDLMRSNLVIKSEKRIFKFSLSERGKDLIHLYNPYKEEILGLLGFNFQI